MTKAEQAVIEAAEGYVDALYSAKFARTMACSDNVILQRQMEAVVESRKLTTAVGALRESRKVGYTVDGEEVALGDEQ